MSKGIFQTFPDRNFQTFPEKMKNMEFSRLFQSVANPEKNRKAKKGEIFKNLGKNVASYKIWKYFPKKGR